MESVRVRQDMLLIRTTLDFVLVIIWYGDQLLEVIHAGLPQEQIIFLRPVEITLSHRQILQILLNVLAQQTTNLIKQVTASVQIQMQELEQTVGPNQLLLLLFQQDVFLLLSVNSDVNVMSMQAIMLLLMVDVYVEMMILQQPMLQLAGIPALLYQLFFLLDVALMIQAALVMPVM